MFIFIFDFGLPSFKILFFTGFRFVALREFVLIKKYKALLHVYFYFLCKIKREIELFQIQNGETDI